MLHSSVRESAEAALAVEFKFPLDVIKAVKANEQAWNNYQGFSDAYRRIRVAYIDAARTRPEEFEKRLRGCVRSLGYVLEWRHETQSIPQ